MGVEYLRNGKALEFLNAGQHTVGKRANGQLVPLKCIGPDPNLPLRSFQIFTTYDGETCFYVDIGKDGTGENIVDGRLNLGSRHVRTYDRNSGVEELFKHADEVLSN